MSDAAPPWFLPALNAVMTAQLAPIKISVAKTRNMLLYNGQVSQAFDIVPFLDGSMPNAPPVSFSPHDLSLHLFYIL